MTSTAETKSSNSLRNRFKAKSVLWTILTIMFYALMIWLLSNLNQFFMEKAATMQCPSCLAKKLFYEP